MNTVNKKILIGSVCVLILSVIFIIIARVTYRVPDKQDILIWNDGQSTETEAETEEELLLATQSSLKSRGYIKIQEMPQNIEKLFQSDVVHVDEMGSAEAEDDSWPEQTLQKYVKYMKGDHFLEQCNDLVVTEPVVNADSKLYLKDLTMMNGDLSEESRKIVEKVEQCGFAGMSDLVSEVVSTVQKRYQKYGKQYWKEFGEVFEITCQGVVFALVRNVTEDGTEVFSYYMCINPSICYAPAQYKEVTDSVMQSGEYFLYSSCVGGQTDNLTFRRNNVVMDLCAEQYALGGDEEKSTGKNISLIFEKGTLKDYYISVADGELVLDEVDRKFLDTYTKGLGKELSEEPQAASKKFINGRYLLYRTK